MNPNNARALRITAAAGTELAGASSAGTVKPDKKTCRAFFPTDSALHPEGLRHTRGVARAHFRALVDASRLLPPVGVWAVSQSQCG